MEVKTIVSEIQRLPLSKKFFVMEQTLKSIKKDELKNQTEIAADKLFYENADDKGGEAFSYVASEKSLGNDWLSEEDNRWDSLL